MRLGTLCSGIGAPEVAGSRFGWRGVWACEVDTAARNIFQHRHPDVELLGDMTEVNWSERRGTVDVLVAGTPCQSYSVAGKRGGLADARGDLTRVFFDEVVPAVRPEWVVWENVPGVMSDDAGRTFGTILGWLAKHGYGWAYRILDAQWFGVAQRRRRVFVVACARGAWQRAAAVLFEPESLRGDPAPSRGPGAATAGALAASAGKRGHPGPDEAGGRRLIAENAGVLPLLEVGARAGGAAQDGIGVGTPGDPMFTLQASKQHGVAFYPVDYTTGEYREDDASTPITGSRDPSRATPVVAYGGNNTQGPIDVATALNASHIASGRQDFESETFIAFDTTQITSAQNRNNPKPGDPCHPLAAGAHPPAVAFKPSHFTRGKDGAPSDVVPPLSADADKGDQDPVVAFNLRGREGGAQPEVTDVASLRASPGGSSRSYVAQSGVRRLTPTECERLMGFEDGYTRVPSATTGGWRDIDEWDDIEALKAAGFPVRLKGNTWRVQDPDGPRYRCLGNSIVVPVLEWIFWRIETAQGALGL